MISLENISKHYKNTNSLLTFKRSAIIRAVDEVSLMINENETLGLVGESGCGKSTLGKVVLRLLEPTSGNVLFEGININSLKQEDLRKLRPKMQIVFQDSYSSMNPRFKIGDIIAEPCELHANMNKSQIKIRVLELLEMVGLNSNHASRYPHELSGGQRQRINIARALALNPKFVVCDEPISALDVSIQAQVVNLLRDLQQKLGLTYLFISHDLSMVKYISDRIAVMYLGKLIEMAKTTDLFENPLHPYTKSLISSIPIPNPRKERSRKAILLKGEAKNTTDKNEGCVFNARCPVANEKCLFIKPEFLEVMPKRFVACHYANYTEFKRNNSSSEAFNAPSSCPSG